MKTHGIQRILVVVKDLEKAAKCYSELLGHNFREPEMPEGFGVRAMVSWDGQMEIISPVDPKSIAARYIERRGEGVIGICYKVDDIDEAGSYIQEKGFRKVNEANFGSVDIWSLFKEIMLHEGDTFGVPIVLVQAELK